ncbi:MAG: 50S ribosomal protein L27 [Candidatus Gracilibacteria bacterium]|nr:50S ribosomal protein L27 [Candidatus Gracilibacteria bacterium]
MAHKKAQGTTNNGRDSQSQRLGVKVFGGQPVKAGGIIIRQKGNKYWAGENTQTGKDFTIFSTIEGKVSFEQKRRVRFDGSVYKDIYVNVK